jgi:dolichol kinase
MSLSPEWRSDLLIMLLAGLYTILSILIPKYLKEKEIITKSTARKLIHSFSGLAILVAPYLNYPILAAIFAFLMTTLMRLSSKKSKTKPLKQLFDAIGEDEELQLGYLQGPYSYCLAITILTFVFAFFPDKFYIPISAILIMMYADVLAAFVGRKYGKHHINIPWVGNKRTLEGSLTFLVSSLILSIFSFFFFGQILPGNSIILTTGNVFLLSFLISIISTLLELFSPSKYDDLIVPLGSTLIVSLCAILMKVW